VSRIGLRIRHLSNSDPWRRHARCLGKPYELFEQPFPVDEDGRPLAQAICEACPVAAKCLDQAIDEGDDTTYRGGMTPDERRAESRARKHNRELEGARS
jgi:WhiB family redox-sensing transcriptional regulator